MVCLYKSQQKSVLLKHTSTQDVFQKHTFLKSAWIPLAINGVKVLALKEHLNWLVTSSSMTEILMEGLEGQTVCFDWLEKA